MYIQYKGRQGRHAAEEDSSGVVVVMVTVVVWEWVLI